MFLSWFWLLFLQFWRFPEVLGKFRASKLQDPRWPPSDNHDVMTTSYDVITSRCGPQKKRTISPPSLIVIAFILPTLWSGTEFALSPPPPPPPIRPPQKTSPDNRPGLDRDSTAHRFIDMLKS